LPARLQVRRPPPAFLCVDLLVVEPDTAGFGASAGARHEPAEGQRGLGRVAEPLGDHGCPEGQDRGSVDADRGRGAAIGGEGIARSADLELGAGWSEIEPR